ncbi:MAG: limonene-1,2-epoxide hydrolase family protein [Caulobacterales bacterium]
MANNEQVIRDFIAAWSRLDVEELVQYFCEDGTYHNMPSQAVTGHDALRPFISGFLQSWTSTEWDVLNLMSKDDVVFAERLDRTLVGTKPVNLPCCGVFEMQNGRIKVWRDYFDLATYVSALRD